MHNNSRKYTVKEIIKEIYILGPLGFFFCIKILSQRYNLAHILLLLSEKVKKYYYLLCFI